MKIICNYKETPFRDLSNDISHINITQRLHITFTYYFLPQKVETGKEKSEMCNFY